MSKSKPSRTRGSANGTANIGSIVGMPRGSSSSLSAKPSTKNRSTTASQGGKVRRSGKKVSAGAGLALVRQCVKTLRDKKAVKIEVIRVAETSSVTDYYIIATGTSDPHLRALRVELEKTIDAVVPRGGVRIQNDPGSGWCVVDAFDVVIHIFSAEKRSYYNLESLYSSGKKIKV